MRLILVEVCIQSAVEIAETRQKVGIVGKRSFQGRFVHVGSFIPAIARGCILVRSRLVPRNNTPCADSNHDRCK
jgi:hypothetical protein